MFGGRLKRQNRKRIIGFDFKISNCAGTRQIFCISENVIECSLGLGVCTAKVTCYYWAIKWGAKSLMWHVITLIWMIKLRDAG